MWVLFWDMHSGGSQKLDWHKIYVEIKGTQSEERAEKMAALFFYNRFGRSPYRVTCTCCGEDYNISSEESLEQLSAFHRGCRAIGQRRGEDGLYQKLPSGMKYYYEHGEEPPDGWELEEYRECFHRYQTLEEYKMDEGVLIVQFEEIKPEELTGSVPEEGYVWR